MNRDALLPYAAGALIGEQVLDHVRSVVVHKREDSTNIRVLYDKKQESADYVHAAFMPNELVPLAQEADARVNEAVVFVAGTDLWITRFEPGQDPEMNPALVRDAYSGEGMPGAAEPRPMKILKKGTKWRISPA